jgi:glycine amidinotransferase
MITVGPDVIEAPMSRRARFFEYLAYRPLVAAYFASDPRMTWVAAPKPTMADAMYRDEFWELTLEQRYAAMHGFEYCITQDEVVFDAADITRLGRDIFVQESMTTNRAGIDWLRRHLSMRGVRVHRLRFPLDRNPSHIDCTFVPLRPGLALTNPDRPVHERDGGLFELNGWQFVNAPEPMCRDADLPRFCQSSRWLAMNVLSLSPTTIVCEEGEHRLHECLTSLGFEVLVVPFTGVYEFGGSLHCATWDIRRYGECEDYFAGLRG